MNPVGKPNAACGEEKSQRTVPNNKNNLKTFNNVKDKRKAHVT